MKRFHVHVGVANLEASIAFYSGLFGAEPAVIKPDYAKWMLDDPRINFAISQKCGADKGIEHLGLQVEDAAELAEVYGRLKTANGPVLEEGATTCCYAKSEKSWIADPDQRGQHGLWHQPRFRRAVIRQCRCHGLLRTASGGPGGGVLVHLLLRLNHDRKAIFRAGAVYRQFRPLDPG